MPSLSAEPLPAAGPRPAPLVLFLHGGFWRAAYDRTHTGPLASALAAAGFVVCTPEYRRTGQRGGGWPRTFDDIAAAVDRLPALVREALGPDAVRDGPPILGGHSAGGHLALWTAARWQIPPDVFPDAALSAALDVVPGAARGAPPGVVPGVARGAPPGVDADVVPGVARGGTPGAAWRTAQPGVAGVVALAAVSDLAACHALGLGRGAVVPLLGGGPSKYPARYRATDPARLLPLGCPVRLVHGAVDDVVPCSMSAGFLARARAAGDDVSLEELPGAGHFDVIDPLSAAWPQVLAAFTALIAGDHPDRVAAAGE